MILVFSEPGKGTSFEIYFPRVQAEASAPAPPAETALRRGSETILVAEDEESLRAMACEMLAGLGYRVLSAGSAGDAIRIIQDTHERVDLLITDVIMPQMNGRELSQRAWSIRPEMRVLYVSGYEADLIQKQGVPVYAADFLAKPFSQNQLAAAVRKILDAKDTVS